MCVIIYKPIGTTVSAEIFKKAWIRNSDGAGFAYADGKGKIEIVKELNDSELFRAKYEEHVVETGLEEKKNMIIHFRIKTHGEVDEKNIHPFRTNHGLVYAHNGTIKAIDVPKDSKESDTILFGKEILNKLPDKWWRSEPIKRMIGEFIGYSKLAFIDVNNNGFLINESKGSWENGVWFSNLLWKNTYTTTHDDYWKNRKWNYKTRTWEKVSETKSYDYDKSKVQIKNSPINYCLECGIPIYTMNEINNNMCTDCLKLINVNMIHGDVQRSYV